MENLVAFVILNKKQVPLHAQVTVHLLIETKSRSFLISAFVKKHHWLRFFKRPNL